MNARLANGPSTNAFAGLAAAAVALTLVGCASTSRIPASAAVLKAPPPLVTMAPIANPPHAAPIRREAARPRSTEAMSSRPHRPSSKTPASRPAETPPPPPATVHDPVRASSLRTRGLEALDRGDVREAVDLLGEADRVDPDNILIRRDLERAQRIARAVSGAH